MDKSLKPVRWIGSSRRDLQDLPKPVRKVFGFPIDQAQRGGKSIDAKPMKGFGGTGIVEIVEDFDGSTFRGVYTVRFAGVVYVLHVFQKKSKHGIATPKHEIELIKKRLSDAERDYQERKNTPKGNLNEKGKTD